MRKSLKRVGIAALVAANAAAFGLFVNPNRLAALSDGVDACDESTPGHGCKCFAAHTFYPAGCYDWDDIRVQECWNELGCPGY